jgi:sugar phosphate isomerase/epimerase
MKILITVALLASSLVAQAETFSAATGLQLYSLRSQFKIRGVPWTLDKVKEHGIREVELAGTFNLSADEFKAELAKRDLIAVSTHFPFGRYRDDLANVVKEAQTLGVKFAGCAWIDHKDSFDEAECRAGIDVFNAAAKALSAVGIQFFYHAHGYEFQPHGDGTLFDLFMKDTIAAVGLEMDVLWIVYPGQDPVKLMQKYGKRWVLMHMKDLKKGVPPGLSGHTDVNNNVVLGQGQVDWTAVLKAAKEIGIAHYFIEDESDTVLEQLPQHLQYLKQVKW